MYGSKQAKGGRGKMKIKNASNTSGSEEFRQKKKPANSESIPDIAQRMARERSSLSFSDAFIRRFFSRGSTFNAFQSSSSNISFKSSPGINPKPTSMS